MAKEFIEVNGRKYKAQEIDFNFICMLGEEGIQIQEMDKKSIPALRAYVAYCMGVDPTIAGAEINNHIINGGSLEDFTTVLGEKAESSDFFRALGQRGQTVEKTSSTRNTKKKEQTEASE